MEMNHTPSAVENGLEKGYPLSLCASYSSYLLECGVRIALTVGPLYNSHLGLVHRGRHVFLLGRT
jgi:hypothetical protein